MSPAPQDDALRCDRDRFPHYIPNIQQIQSKQVVTKLVQQSLFQNDAKQGGGNVK